MSIYIVNKDNNLKYIFDGVGDIHDNLHQDVTNFSVLQSGADDSMSFRMSGVTRTIRFSFKLRNREDDASGGTAGLPVKTIQEQYAYLTVDIFKSDNQNGWTFTWDEMGIGVSVTIEDLNLDNTDTDPEKTDCNISLVVGEVEL